MLSEAEIANLSRKAIILPRQPHAWSDNKEYDDGRGGEFKEVKHTADGWCVETASWGGDESGETLCFARGRLQNGRSYFAGGSIHEVKYQLLEG